ncbi:MAG: MarR family transcriptional regulator [Saprospiraceae bacterium]|jgi:DNA-binding MarR family transcriptional regulator|nr:MarR family transcriptional regulator [Saprospiraceae bacterium]
MKIEEAIKTKFLNPIHKVAVNISYTSNWLRDEQAHVFKEHDLLPQHFNVLRILAGKHPEPVSPGVIKEVMIDKGADVTRLLAKLEERGFVQRQIRLDNRRMIDVSITGDGLALTNGLAKKIKETTKTIQQNITPEEAEQLSHLLDKLRG